LEYDQHISAEFIKNNITDYEEIYKELVTTNYPLYGWRNETQWIKHTKIPSTLPACYPNGCTFSEYTGILADSRTPVEYDNWLQEYTENDLTGEDTWYGDFIAIMKTSSTAAKLSNMPFMPMLQTHLWHEGISDYAQREPTNEELKMMGNVAISYGSKGILWFWGGFSWGERPTWGPNTNYVRGLLECDFSKQHDNVYGQWQDGAGTSKFNTVRDLNILYHDKWGQYLMSFNQQNTNSYIYRDPSERGTFLNTYFSEILTYPANPNNYLEPLSQPDDPAHTYIQASTFKNDNEPFTYYFMLVNKRCSPFRLDISEYGGWLM
jgi:hypothetical protein